MTLADRESSRYRGQQVELVLFRGAPEVPESLLQGVNIIPGTTMFGYGTTVVTTANGSPLNNYAAQQTSDFVASLEDLRVSLPNVKKVNLVVGWHGDDLRIGSCEIRPRAESASVDQTPYVWNVGGVTPASATLVSQIEGDPAVGGAPADRSVYEAIVELKARGYAVTLYPFIYMDIPTGNGKTDPYGGAEQGAYPWRGRITCHPAPGQPGSPDGTATAATQVSNFFGTADAGDFSWNSSGKRVSYSGPSEWSFRRFILHLAQIADAAGGVDGFLIGSEMVGMTRVRSAAHTYPAIAQLKSLAAEVRTMLGAETEISYAADWSEYHSHQVDGHLNFNMDPLWSDSNIDYIGIDNYLPIADWREGTTHKDRVAGYTSQYDTDYLMAGIEGGEYFDWYYTSDVSRNAQNRLAITDGGYGEPWVYRQKDLRNWWLNDHHERVSGSRAATPTDWVPGSKRVVFTEFGCPAIDKGANQPNVFYDPKSSESAVPHYSNGKRDDSIQRAYIEATVRYWRANAPTLGGTKMISQEDMIAWAFDARPYPLFPRHTWRFGDHANYDTGHWLNGRMRLGGDYQAGIFGPYGFTSAEQPIVKDGVTYLPAPLSRGSAEVTGGLDKQELTINIGRGIDPEFDTAFVTSSPETVVSALIYRGHAGEDPNDPRNFVVVWSGRVNAPSKTLTDNVLSCEPIATTLRRVGPRRHYQLSCPHVLYGPECRANKGAATVQRVLYSAPSGNRIELTSALPQTRPIDKFLGGTVEWVGPDGATHIRSITKVVSGRVVEIRGTKPGLVAGGIVRLSLGCNRRLTDCREIHNNALNFGGQPHLATDNNPFGNKSQFY